MNIIEKVYDFYEKYKGEKGFIGYTELGKKIPYIKVAKSAFPIIIVQYCIQCHLREAEKRS